MICIIICIYIKIWIIAAVISHIIIDTACAYNNMIGSIMNSACGWNIAIDVAIVGLVIGVRFVETLLWIKEPLKGWPGPNLSALMK